MKDAYFFPHDSNAQNDPKIMLLMDEMNPEGVGIYWLLIETLRDQHGYRCPIELLPSLARRWNTSVENVEKVVNDFNLFQVENGFFFSDSFDRRMRRVNISRISGIKGNLIRYNHLSKEEADDMSSDEILEFNESIHSHPRDAPDSHKRKEEKRKTHINKNKGNKSQENASVANEVMGLFNKICSKDLKATSHRIKLINILLKSNHSIEDFKKVIEKKYKEWHKDAKMKVHIMPETLFKSEKFQQYLDQSEIVKNYQIELPNDIKYEEKKF